MSSGQGEPEAGEVTRLLEAWGKGDRAALERLVPLVYDELRRIAARARRREPPGLTLQTTWHGRVACLRPTCAITCATSPRMAG